jgi:hypothetical protein
MNLSTRTSSVIALSILFVATGLFAQTPHDLPWWKFGHGRTTPTPTPTPPPRAAVVSTPSDQVSLPPTPLIQVPPGVVANPDDTAHFLAGMPVPNDSPLMPFTQTAA